MPKRIPTPEPGDDEPKYYTVVQPYPLHANWELPHDYITCGRWIAGCIGPDTLPFTAILYKPSARGQIIIEIDRNYPEPERLLGEHRWSEFLKKPNAEEQGRVSQIFYSTYATGRQAQKDGWKRINVADSWFTNWNPVNPVIAHPYPATVWCPLPPEDKTNKPMCRPLPVSVKPPPATKSAPPPPVVPGSASWAQQKAAPPTNTPAAMRGAWAAKAATSAANAQVNNKGTGANGNKGNANGNKGGAGKGGANGNGKKTIPANSTAPWHIATAPRSSNTVAAKPVSPAASAPAFPPGLPPLAPPGLTRGGSTSTASTASTASADALAADFVAIAISPSMEANLYGAVPDTSPDPGAYVAEWEKMPVADVDALWPGAYSSYTSTPLDYTPSETVENLWGEEAAIDNSKVNAKPPNDIVCTVHGIICKKGICSERAKLVREKERAEKLAKEREEREAKGGGGKRGGGGGWNKAGGGGRGRNSGGNNGGGWEKRNPWNDNDDSGSATGSEGRSGTRSPAPAPKNDGWATVRR
ncbi:hypothetical protein C8R45DRAFT_989296 [Mycena sanguinolenta]|nr:hypothetical protein C8R45DRAFT_989296 [Mycena sanguinolenta]